VRYPLGRKTENRASGPSLHSLAEGLRLPRAHGGGVAVEVQGVELEAVQGLVIADVNRVSRSHDLETEDGRRGGEVDDVDALRPEGFRQVRPQPLGRLAVGQEREIHVFGPRLPGRLDERPEEIRQPDAPLLQDPREVLQPVGEIGGRSAKPAPMVRRRNRGFGREGSDDLLSSAIPFQSVDLSIDTPKPTSQRRRPPF